MGLIQPGIAGKVRAVGSFYLEDTNMAVQNSGTKPRADNPDPAMVEQQHYDARSGKPKNTQTDFPVKPGMKDQTVMSRVGPGMSGSPEPNPAYHFGPDASSANPSDPETPAQRGKVLKRQPGALIPSADGQGSQYTPGTLKPTWGMKGTGPRGIQDSGEVLGDAILSGSTKLPASVSAASGPAPAYTGKDPN
jgi:hypothetical protein